MSNEKIKKPTTHVLMIVDMSGSMSHLAADVRGGFNTYITGLSEDSTARYRLTACVFDTEYILLCAAAKLSAVPKLDHANYTPRGGTALLDAVGRTVAEFDSQTPVLPDGDRVIVVVQTDGQENSSCEFNWDRISELIKTREATGKWSFVYLGAGADTWAQASRMGFAANNYVNTAKTTQGTAASYSGLLRSTVSFAAGASGATVAALIASEPGAVDNT